MPRYEVLPEKKKNAIPGIVSCKQILKWPTGFGKNKI